MRVLYPWCEVGQRGAVRMRRVFRPRRAGVCRSSRSPLRGDGRGATLPEGASCARRAACEHARSRRPPPRARRTAAAAAKRRGQPRGVHCFRLRRPFAAPAAISEGIKRKGTCGKYSTASAFSCALPHQPRTVYHTLRLAVKPHVGACTPILDNRTLCHHVQEGLIRDPVRDIAFLPKKDISRWFF